VVPADARGRIASLARAIAADPSRYHADALTALAAHRQAGERVIVVSGSEETLVRGVLDGLGFPDVEVVASRLDLGGPRVRVLRHCFGAAKPRALAEPGVEAWTCAYTDSLADLPLLDRAARAVLVNASAAAIRRATQHLGREPESVRWR
jgi:phosphatidylglycerophosphatase C